MTRFAFIDPLFSTGVLTVVTCGKYAAKAIHEAISWATFPPSASASYQQQKPCSARICQDSFTSFAHATLRLCWISLVGTSFDLRSHHPKVRGRCGSSCHLASGTLFREGFQRYAVEAFQAVLDGELTDSDHLAGDGGNQDAARQFFPWMKRGNDLGQPAISRAAYPDFEITGRGFLAAHSTHPVLRRSAWCRGSSARFRAASALRHHQPVPIRSAESLWQSALALRLFVSSTTFTRLRWRSPAGCLRPRCPD